MCKLQISIFVHAFFFNHPLRKHRVPFFSQAISSYSHSPVAGNLPPSGHCLLPSSSPPPPLLPVRHHTAATLNNTPRSSLVWSHTTAPRGGIVKDPPIWAGGWPGSSSSYRSPPLVMNAPVGSCWPGSQY